jgi:arginine/lysine/ornithine decarboxylase
VHAHGVPLLVDEAHGAHYGFHPGVPASAMAEGADAAVQSTHKMLTSLTMGAMLHVQGELIDRSIIRQRLAMLQSSSPSYPIMASLDLSRRLMHTDGKALIDAALQRVVDFGQQLAELSDSYELLQPAPTDTYTTLDPFKISIRSTHGTLSGYQLQQLLEEYGCVAEMADPRYVLLALSLHTSEKDLARAIEALRQIAVTSLPPTKQQTIDSYIIEETNWNQAAMSSRVSLPAIIQLPAVRGNGQATEVVKLSDAIDRVAAEMVIPYPPGIPILYPGESVTAATAVCLTELARLGARFQGCRDVTLQSILVTK